VPILEALRLEIGVLRALGSHWAVTSLIVASGFIVFSSLICCDFALILDIVKEREMGRKEDERERGELEMQRFSKVLFLGFPKTL
jgi:hypothetical protein